jgi:hypothetical protein
VAQLNDRACPNCPDTLSLIQLGPESADRWQLIHNSGRVCTWLTTVAPTDSTTVGVPIATAKNSGHSKQR